MPRSRVVPRRAARLGDRSPRGPDRRGRAERAQALRDLAFVATGSTTTPTTCAPRASERRPAARAASAARRGDSVACERASPRSPRISSAFRRAPRASSRSFAGRPARRVSPAATAWDAPARRVGAAPRTPRRRTRRARGRFGGARRGRSRARRRNETHGARRRRGHPSPLAGLHRGDRDHEQPHRQRDGSTPARQPSSRNGPPSPRTGSRSARGHPPRRRAVPVHYRWTRTTRPCGDMPVPAMQAAWSCFGAADRPIAPVCRTRRRVGRSTAPQAVRQRPCRER